MRGTCPVVVFIAFQLVASACTVRLAFSGLPDPVVSEIDMKFGATGLTISPPGNPYFRDNVKFHVDVTLKGTQTWTKGGVVLDVGRPGENDSIQLGSPALIYEGGDYRMWYAGTNKPFPTSYILYTTSPDGTTWTKYGVVLGLGVAGEEYGVHYPSVMKDGGVYKMWYSGYDAPDSSGHWRIFYATSSDGTTWTRRGLVVDLGPAGSYDSRFTYRPFVIKESEYRMWYTGFDGSHPRLLCATSPDGVTWTKRGLAMELGPSGSLDDNAVYWNTILVEGGGYHMWYTGHDGSTNRIFYAISGDGLAWTRQGMVLDISPPVAGDDRHAALPWVIHLTGRLYQMWYIGRGGSSLTDRVMYANLATIPLPVDTEVNFYLDGISPSKLIGTGVAEVGAFSSVEAEISWVAQPRGPHTIYAVVDPSNKIAELDESNNTASLNIIVLNHPPVAEADRPYSAFEGDMVALNASGSYDIDDDDLFYRWDYTYDGTWDTGWLTDPIYFLSYGDDFVGEVKLQVFDGYDTANDTANLTISNVLPSGTLTIASSEQHEGSPIQFSADVTDPGSDDLFLWWTWGYGAPDEYSASYNNGVSPDPYPSPDINPRDITDTKSHTYGDDGAFTVTVFVKDDDSGATGITMTITATPDNLPPSVSVAGGMNIDEGESIRLDATATDPGSDDLTFAWDFGDGRSKTTIVYNDGFGPDPYPSPEVNPITATSEVTLVYYSAGTYTIMLTVTDDDGGMVLVSFTVRVG